MRKYFLLFAAFVVIASCSDKKKTTDKTVDDTEDVTPKKKKGGDDLMTDDTKTTKKTTDDDIMPKNHNSDTGSWSKSDESTFMDQCTGTAAKKVGPADAKTYCSCMMEKAEKSFSSYSDADRNMTKTQLNSWASDCNDLIKQ